MVQRKSLTVITSLLVMLFCLSCFPASAQTDDSIEQLKQRVLELKKQTRYTEALPLLEKIVAAEPNNAEMHFYLGFALIAKATTLTDPVQRKALRVRARDAFIRSKELEIHEPLVQALIQTIPPDGSEGAAFSENIEANGLMTEAEAFFSQGKLDEALKDYLKALELDPKLYHAALFAGDVFIQKDDFAQAEVWYKRAIAIDPNRETAYRYSATPLMKQGKTQQARDLYIEAFISEPYNQFARAGLIQWGQATRTVVGHPSIDLPSITFDEKGNAKIDLDTDMLQGAKDDGSFAWVSYGATRTAWRKEQFAKRYPKEPAYRHSLAEEAEALRSVIKLATGDKRVKDLSPSLAKIKKLNDEGLLEAYILLARADEGIAKDHPAYLRESRDKLRRYVIEYVVARGEE